MEEEQAPVAGETTLQHSLEDLKVGVQLRIGTTMLPLRSILNMKVGEVVPLDRPLASLVQVLAGGRMVATGDLVISNGFYAVQIKEVSTLEIHLLEDAPVY
jgi:flagellar motor switch protein FliN/FliY